MSGFGAIARIRQLEHCCRALGFEFARPKHGMRNHDVLALIPIADQLPVYSREAEVFVGTIEELEVWLRGVEWARQYDQLLRLSNQTKRERREQAFRNQQLMAILSKNFQEDKK